MPSGMSGSDNSIAESLPPPPNLGRGRLIAPFRIGANAPNQNSAGKYPLISRPMQISTRVGVVQAIGRPPEFLKQAQSSARQARAQAPGHTRVSKRRRCKRGPKKNRTLAGPVTVCRRGGRQSPSRGEQLTALRLQSGRMDNRLPPVHGSMPRRFPHTMQRLACQPCGSRLSQTRARGHPRRNAGIGRQKCQRCALATRKSRNTCTRATVLSSSG